jgi:hypothetical protein
MVRLALEPRRSSSPLAREGRGAGASGESGQDEGRSLDGSIEAKGRWPPGHHGAAGHGGRGPNEDLLDHNTKN